ncbi:MULTISPECIES: DeoR/GlpR family DNA-binding transcription regulator [unclassified Janthinobacterium]|uniref:DeoR/GlpR family DNA-binding transcription regulator n=1 Tax=unclassified Janthinobacterium TaxID=2610881 RepID=UPI00161D84B2|nr:MULTISPECIES: DeoR/GlpR family DNA-binding transcription regulator [unclassified Janthinobacterium]MBB5371055.1 DeoR/GlpR family transcriptional regulator of sugar metabolism [Janthinobacterium sp. K2C7]MBB5383861.1 DeoR/GlpR family transcriptional regulator of sugar metabolism [Janthinobacterium sp. K2Li3]MBB5389317.1 DeoR/GlpR family transcriptional regulator of sugar metabolism [Janthinobacterium sp. K2E3]
MTSTLLLKQRQTLIQQQLLADGRVLALDLARQLDVSEDTIRRDLREMAAAGLCQRVYGGALPLSPDGGTLSQRKHEAPERKASLAQAAVTLVRAGQVLFIDAGSTNLAIASALPKLALTVITNAPSIAMALMERNEIELIIAGGRVDRRAGASLGPQALRTVERMRPDLCFLGACGADVDAGVTAFNYDEAEFKRSIAGASKAVVVAATSDKLGTAAPFGVLATGLLQHLVLEADADAVHADAFERLGVHVLRARK